MSCMSRFAVMLFRLFPPPPPINTIVNIIPSPPSSRVIDRYNRETRALAPTQWKRQSHAPANRDRHTTSFRARCASRNRTQNPLHTLTKNSFRPCMCVFFVCVFFFETCAAASLRKRRTDCAIKSDLCGVLSFFLFFLNTLLLLYALLPRTPVKQCGRARFKKETRPQARHAQIKKYSDRAARQVKSFAN